MVLRDCSEERNVSALLPQAKPPAPGEPSYELWITEKNAILASLKSRAKLAADTFNTMPGFKCNEVRVRTLLTHLSILVPQII